MKMVGQNLANVYPCPGKAVCSFDCAVAEMRAVDGRLWVLLSDGSSWMVTRDGGKTLIAQPVIV